MEILQVSVHAGGPCVLLDAYYFHNANIRDKKWFENTVEAEQLYRVR
jgi:hypothetical protein